VVQYLRLKPNKSKTSKSILFRERNKVYSKRYKEKYIPKKHSILITGLEASGKSKMLLKLYEEKNNVYPKAKGFLFIKCTDNLTDWFRNFDDGDVNDYLETLDEDEVMSIEKDLKKQYMKIQILVNTAKEKIVFIDDIDMVSGKKREVLKDILRVSKLVIVTAKDDKNMDKSIVNFFYRHEHTIIPLGTQGSYDATNYIFVTLLVAMLASGAYEVAAFIMMLRYGMKGVSK
jgi:nucleoside-triphosphatase THEP1